MRFSTLCAWVALLPALRLQSRAQAAPEEVAAADIEVYKTQLRQLLMQLVWAAKAQSCFAIITDDLHYSIYDGAFFRSSLVHSRLGALPYYMLRIGESEDLLPPPAETQRLLRAIRAHDCDVHVLTLLNGAQLARLLQYVYESRSLNGQQKFLLLYDERLLQLKLLHVWTAMVNAVFVRRAEQPDAEASFSIYSIAYPGILSGVLVLEKLGDWRSGRSVAGKAIFRSKTSNLNAAQLPVALIEHAPMVQLVRSTNRYEGVEIRILEALAKALNFQPVYYRVNESSSYSQPGSLLDDYAAEQGNSSSTGLQSLIGEVAEHNARLAIGDLHLLQSYLELVETSVPHSFECLTFLTPESSRDSSWQTFIVPFSGSMWSGVLLSLVLVGSVFYLISYLNACLMGRSALPQQQQRQRFFGCLRRRQRQRGHDELQLRRLSFRLALNRLRRRRAAQLQPQDLFDNYANCLLLTYSMLLYVALPRMPRNWPLRVLSGWYWIYCILLVATYRASFTAILANPAKRITIDTVQDLVSSRLAPSAGVAENKQLFLDAKDEIAQQLGAHMQIVDPQEDLTERISSGRGAYFDNEYFLRYLRVGEGEGEGDGYNRSVSGSRSSGLHIMRQCVFHMPVVLALEKNSPLKPHIDRRIMQLSEGGFISKWLRDAIKRLPAEEEPPQEALMNLNKFWSSFVALAIGYFIAVCVMLAERWHFQRVVMRHPLYDVYNPGLYYTFKRCYPDL